MSILKARDIRVTFGGVNALSDVSFDVQEGSICGLIGPNGSGKTTMFNVISGLVRPVSGTMEIFGEDRTNAAPVSIARAGVGRTFQIVRPLEGLTCAENLLPGLIYGRDGLSLAAAQVRARELLDLVGLGAQADTPAASMSLWQKKLLETARALSVGPRLLLLDEVFAGLTPNDVDQVVDVVQTVHKEMDLTILIVEHVMRATMALCDHVIVLSYGELLREGSPEEVVNDPAVIEVYLGTRSVSSATFNLGDE